MMAQYRDVITRNGLPYDFVSSHESKWRAKFAVVKLKEESRYRTWGGYRGRYVTIATRIIKAPNGRYLVYSRDK